MEAQRTKSELNEVINEIFLVRGPLTGNTWRKFFCTNALSSDVRCETLEVLVVCSVDMNPLCLYPQLEEGIRVTVVEDLCDNFNLMNSSLRHLLYEELSLINNIDDLDFIPLKENMIFIPYSKFCQIIFKNIEKITAFLCF